MAVVIKHMPIPQKRHSGTCTGQDPVTQKQGEQFIQNLPN